jgi:hypothetical protein
LDRFAGGVTPVYDASPCLISAHSDIYHNLTVDPDKTIVSWNSMLPYIYTFNYAAEPIYTANMIDGQKWRGQCISFKHILSHICNVWFSSVFNAYPK